MKLKTTFEEIAHLTVYSVKYTFYDYFSPISKTARDKRDELEASEMRLRQSNCEVSVK